MLNIQIPIQVVAGAQALMTADATTFNRFEKVITEIPPCSSTRKFLEALIQQSSDSITPKIVDFLFFVGYYKHTMGDPVLIGDYSNAMTQSVKRMVANALDVNVLRFKGVLEDFLFARNNLGLTFKANVLMTQNERNFLQVRLLSEIRTIFDEEVVDEPLAAIICHVMKFNYLEGETRKEFYIGLDDTELAEIKDAIVRAEAKSDQLKKLLESSGLRQL